MLADQVSKRAESVRTRTAWVDARVSPADNRFGPIRAGIGRVALRLTTSERPAQVHEAAVLHCKGRGCKKARTNVL